MEILRFIDSSVTLKKFTDKYFNISSCIMLTGDDENTLLNLAKYFTMNMVCESYSRPCFNCNSCKKIISENAIEVKYYPKNKSEISVDDIKELIADAIERPLDFDKKIYILHNIDKSQIAAQNKLLKILEEFPVYVRFIFTATNPDNVLPTILSRVTRINIPVIPYVEFENLINIYKQSDSLPLNMVYELCNGNLISGYNIIFNDDVKKIYNNCLEIMESINKDNIYRYTEYIDKNNSGIYLKIFSFIVNKMIYNRFDLATEYSIINIKYTLKSLIKIADLLQQSFIKLKNNTNEQSVIDNLLIGIMEAKI